VIHIVEFDEVRNRLLARVRDEYKSLADSFNSAADELAEFYRAHGPEIFNYAKRLGGMKAVAGGQRQFTESGLEATRISGLYTDTQLIPDPVYPFLASDLQLNAKHLQLAHILYYLLQLKPLVDARLPVPVIVVFPSFEEPLEEHDAATKAGIEALLLQVAAPVCEGSITAVGELLEFAARYPDKYLPAVMAAQIFVPVGHEPGDFHNAQDALRAHIAGIEGMRLQEEVDVFKNCRRASRLRWPYWKGYVRSTTCWRTRMNWELSHLWHFLFIGTTSNCVQKRLPKSWSTKRYFLKRVS